MEPATTTEPPPSGPRGLLPRLLRLFAEVKPSEIATVLLLSINVFVLLTAYYLLKVAREPLILLYGGAEVKSYASAGQAITLIVVSMAYGALARRVGRLRLITAVTLFFAANILLFAGLLQAHVAIAVPFYLWVGIFSVTMVAQFWGFAADLYTDEQGKRLFPIVGIGSSAGAVAGSMVARRLMPLGPTGLMLASTLLLLVTLGLAFVTHRREAGAPSPAGPSVEAGIGGAEGGFSLVLKDRYLLLLGGMSLILNWINTTGEYVLDRTLLSVAGPEARSLGMDVALYVGQFKADYFAWVNVIGMLLQLFAVSRIIKYVGLRPALFIMPTICLAGYSILAAAPLLSLIFAAKVAENSLDYSLGNTTRQALWLVVSREAKYKAKQVVDTFLVRAGDVMSAATVWIGLQWGLGTVHFVGVNITLAATWLAGLVLLTREHARRSAAAPEAEACRG